MKDDTTNWYEVRCHDGIQWRTCDLSECHPGDLVRVNSSDGPGEPFIYAEPEPLEHNVGAVPTVDEPPAKRSFDPREDIVARIQSFSPSRHGPASCPWCGELFGPQWEIEDVIVKSMDWDGDEEERNGSPHAITCPRCGWLGTFVRLP